jgi:hypothetical protein
MFHDVNPSYFGRPEGALGQAERLHTTVESLRRVATTLISDPTQEPLEARRLLATLCMSLAVCFDAAEARRYFGGLLAERPDLQEGVDELLNGRGLLRDSVTYVRKMAFRSADTGDLGRGITRVLERFERHEESENHLVQRFFRDECASTPPGAA